MHGTFKQTGQRSMWLAKCLPGDDLLVLTILSRRSRRESIVLTLARISHNIEAHRGANQRKFFCDKDFAMIQG
jgi:hypothetical protein